MQRVLDLIMLIDPVLSALGLITLILFIQVILLSRRMSALTKGTGAASLESTIADTHARVAKLEERGKTVELALNNLDLRIGTAVRSVVVRRFDPFENAGGQQSFATALLDESGDGVVISGIHARDSVRVYAKDVHGFVSERELSADEERAIDDAKKKLA